MANFLQTLRPTPFTFFDNDPQFQAEADGMVTFVKRRLGDDVLSVELTSKEIWACFEEATLEYGSLIAQYKVRSELANLLGVPTVFSGSITVTGSSTITNIFSAPSLAFMMRQATAYSVYAGLSGDYDVYNTYLDLSGSVQNYDLYQNLRLGDGPNAGKRLIENLPSGSISQLRILDVFHFNPTAGLNSYFNATNTANWSANEFGLGNNTTSNVFYVLPVFEDILRRGQLELTQKIRRSNFSYMLQGRNIQIFPIPQPGSANGTTKLWMKVATGVNVLGLDENGIANGLSTIGTIGISSPGNAPIANVEYTLVNAMGRQWIRQYTLALAKELLGMIRSKMKTIPIPGAELQLNGEDLMSAARDDKDKLRTDLKELFDSLTYEKLISMEAQKAEDLARQLRLIPPFLGKAIWVG